MIVAPKIRGFICTTAHPEGCAKMVNEQISYVKKQDKITGPKKVLVIGASTGYGLASRICASFGAKADTIGVFFERPSEGIKTASPGWYNTAAFEEAAAKEKIYAKSINGDAFSNEIKDETIALAKSDWGLESIDCVVYSLAAPKRKDPNADDKVYSSVLKPIDKPYNDKTVNFMTGKVSDVNIEPANNSEVANTIKVMGGEDWQLWIKKLAAAKLLSKNAVTVAYSYIGPELTYPIYRNGTIGKAKDHLEKAAHNINDFMQKEVSGSAYVSVNKALVTQASAAIPVVPLYISLLYKIMKKKKTQENCVQQIYRLFKEKLYSKSKVEVDNEGRIRIDDLEMDSAVQKEIQKIWPNLNTDNLSKNSDIAGYREEFYNLFGFNCEGIDYSKDIDVDIQIPSLK